MDGSKGTIESQYSHNSKNTRETNMQHGRKKVSTFSIEIHLIHTSLIKLFFTVTISLSNDCPVNYVRSY